MFILMNATLHITLVRFSQTDDYFFKQNIYMINLSFNHVKDVIDSRLFHP